MKKLEEEKNSSAMFWQAVKEEHHLARLRLHQKLTAEFDSNDQLKHKLQEKRKEQLRKAEEYRNELEEMNRRLKDRALIIEQQEMLIEKQRFTP
ncbi:unnamed protein product [Dracunculus medinensis]|uniref:Uncharacterized protein n=1 Tax=Dracunculus medinensis TaxID=318479 RepID=A0A0N4U4H1_DRAME|nr:unnamed protein product [Dracunculus medinensis]